MTSLITAQLFSGNETFGAVEGLSSDGDGNIYASCGNQRLLKIVSGTPNTFVLSFTPRGICVVSNRVFLANYTHSTISVSTTTTPGIEFTSEPLNTLLPQGIISNYDGISGLITLFVSSDNNPNFISYHVYDLSSDTFITNGYFDAGVNISQLAFRRVGGNQYLYGTIRETSTVLEMNVTSTTSVALKTINLFDTSQAWGLAMYPGENLMYVADFAGSGGVYAYNFITDGQGSITAITGTTPIAGGGPSTSLVIGQPSGVSSVVALPLWCVVDSTTHLYVGTADTYIADFYGPLICVGRGTRIRCKGGDRLIEDLVVGDEIVTLKGNKKIADIRKSTLRGYCSNSKSNLPFRVPKNYFGGLPSTDLVISGSHAIWRNDHFRHVSCMRCFSPIQELIGETFEMYHLSLDEYPCVMFANDLPVETCAEYVQENGSKIVVECSEEECRLLCVRDTQE
jgi:hypothetical protein